MNVLKIKDWKLVQENKQFVFMAPHMVRRLSDNELFSTNVTYIHTSSALPEYVVTVEIVEFNPDQIHLRYQVKSTFSQWYQLDEINRLEKGKTANGLIWLHSECEGDRSNLIRRPRRKIK